MLANRRASWKPGGEGVEPAAPHPGTAVTAPRPTPRRAVGSIFAAGPAFFDLQTAIVCEVRMGGAFGIETLDLAEAVEARAGRRLNPVPFAVVLAALRLRRQIGRRRGERSGRAVALWYPTSGRALEPRGRPFAAAAAPV